MKIPALFMLVCVACSATPGDDSSNKDASALDVTTSDSSNDAGGDASDAKEASVCPTPADITGFAPTPIHPAKIAKGACTTAQIDQYFQDCIAGAGCGQFATSMPTCFACLASDISDPTWGPAVNDQGGVMFNTTGCIVAVTGDSSSSSCAQKFDDARQCVIAACEKQCPIVKQADIALLEQCMNSAGSTVCASFVNAECSPDAGSYQQCIGTGSTDPQANFDAIGAAMCGP